MASEFSWKIGLLGHSSAMPDRTDKAAAIQSALICIETPLDRSGHPVALPKIYGNAVIFHQIKMLERAGVTDIVLAVDTIPAELPELAERLSHGATKIRIVRQSAELSQDELFGGDFLLLAPQIWVGAELLAQILPWPANTIGILAEDPANTRFERIDLNRRWAGLAVLDRTAIAHCAKMPEGWSIASFLLRHGLQSAAKEVSIDQERVTDGALRIIGDAEDMNAITAGMKLTHGESGFLEGLVGSASSSWVPTIANRPALVAGLTWSPLAIAIASTLTAYFRFSGISLVLLFLTLGVDVIRQQLRAAEYRLAGSDYPAIGAFLALFGTGWLLFFNNGAEPADASFVSLLLFALLLLSRWSPDAVIRRIISPLNLGFALLVLWVTMPFLDGAKILVLALLSVHLVIAFRAKRRPTELNAN
jgi:hypothetical protein